jgi:hypothetical protein
MNQASIEVQIMHLSGEQNLPPLNLAEDKDCLDMELVIHQDDPEYDLWIKLLLAFSPALTFFLGVLLYYGVLQADTEDETRMAAWILFASTAFVLLLYWAVLPRSYLILEDRLRIRFGVFSFSVPFATITEVKAAEGLFFGGLSAASSFTSKVGILRKKGMDVAISPRNRDLFIENLKRALAAWRERQGLSH